MLVRQRWLLAAFLTLAPSPSARAVEFALGAELVRSIGHSSHAGHLTLSDAAGWGVGIIAEERLSSGRLQLLFWEEIQSSIELPDVVYIADAGRPSFPGTSPFVPVEVGARPSLRIGIVEPHVGLVLAGLFSNYTVYGLGGDAGADVRLGIFLVGVDFRAMGLVDSRGENPGPYTSLFQGLFSVRLLLL